MNARTFFKIEYNISNQSKSNDTCDILDFVNYSFLEALPERIAYHRDNITEGICRSVDIFTPIIRFNVTESPENC